MYNIWKPYLLQWICTWKSEDFKKKKKSEDFYQLMILKNSLLKGCGGLLQII